MALMRCPRCIGFLARTQQHGIGREPERARHRDEQEPLSLQSPPPWRRHRPARAAGSRPVPAPPLRSDGIDDGRGPGRQPVQREEHVAGILGENR